MEQFKQKFIEEAIDLINDLENALLIIESNPDDKELLNKIFRIMHSLKGGSDMFGFHKMDKLTHYLETIYDYIRNDKIKLSKSILSFTLNTVDHLRKLLDEDKHDADFEVAHQQTLLQVQELIAEIEREDINLEFDEETEEKGAATIRNKQQLFTYYISFIPEEDIMINGTNPLFLIDEMHTIGKCIAFPRSHKIAEIENIDPSKCYTYWDIFLATGEGINTIIDVFIFVDDHCKLEVHKISEYNLLEEEAFTGIVRENIKANKSINLSDLQELARDLEKIFETSKKTIDTKVERTAETVISSIRVSSDKIDSLMNLVSELVTTQARLSLIAEESLNPKLVSVAEEIQKLSRQLRDTAFSISLLPIESMLTRFKRLVRDLSNEMSKDIIFEAEGTETELDKTIIQSLTDPLLHILRNSIDHGIENKENRLKNNKPEKGKIKLKAYYSGANVHISIIDDGKGIDPEKIKQKAIEKGLINSESNLSEQEILNMIFLPGFSTAETVSSVSGRGVGMDVVKRKISDLRGDVEIESEVGKGTTITIKLPLTLSIIDGLLTEIDSVFYIIPLSVVDKIYAAQHNKLVDTYNNLITLDGEQVPFYYMREEFQIEENNIDVEQIVVVNFENNRIGIAVDKVVGQYQAVLKPLGKHYKGQEFISGASILGDGTVALVMDTNKMIKKLSTN